MNEKQHVLIVGAGFGGVKAALELAGDNRFKVTVLSNDHDLRYYPTLYATATGTARSNSSIPLSTIFGDTEVQVVQGTAEVINREAKAIICEDGQSIKYDCLILALGVVTNYFDIPGLGKFSYSIKSQAEAERFKAHLHKQIEDDRKPDLNYVVVGAGPTGVELAGALPGYLRCVMSNHDIDYRKIHVDLIEAGPRLLPNMPKDASRMVARQLKRLGVNLYLNSRVSAETVDQLKVNGKAILSHTVVWTAGVTNHPFFSQNAFALTKRGKVSVNVYLQAEDGIFVIGDNANTPYSGMAQTALYDGKFVAMNLKRQAVGKSFKSYKAKHPVTVMSAGPKWAAVVWGKLRIYGWLGWALRESADLVGYHDLEPWYKATKQWFRQFTRDDTCDTCAAKAVR